MRKADVQSLLMSYVNLISKLLSSVHELDMEDELGNLTVLD